GPETGAGLAPAVQSRGGPGRVAVRRLEVHRTVFRPRALLLDLLNAARHPHRGAPMRRIGLAVVLTVSFLTTPLATEAQTAVTLPRIGILSAFSPYEPASPQPFWQAMRELGWIEGQNIVVERRWAELRLDRLPALATELVQLKVDLILTTAGAE